MVAGKLNPASLALQRSQAKAKPKPKPKLDPSAPPTLLSSSASVKRQQPHTGSGVVGVYSPRTSVQVQPRPPDVSELLRLVEELRESESRLKVELVEQRLLGETGAVVPVLQNVISCKDLEIERFGKKIGCLEAENERLREENEFLHMELSRQNHRYEERIKLMQIELSDIKRASAQCELGCEASSSSSTTSKIDKSQHLKRSLTQNIRNEANDRIIAGDEFVGGESFSRCISEEIQEASDGLARIKSRAPRVPKPPPPPVQRPPVKPAAPPPPPPTGKGFRPQPAKVSRVPEVVEFYHSVMRRDSNWRRDTRGGGADAQAAVATAKDMIGEINSRSAHLLAIKTDVETRGDFVRFLIKEVEGAAFTDIESVVAFVKWLDDELSNLVDERAVLKHFDWPEKKADALREAAFGYFDLKKLEAEVSSFLDDPRQPCKHALRKMKSLFEKLEHGVYNLSRMRESAAERYRGFRIPVDWMLDTGYVSQIKLASVKLAMKYMKRVSAELEMVGGGPEEQELIVQGVKFAFRVHQFAGGFDVETMTAFQELRAKAQ